jgi:hypothetical protein
MQLRDASNLAFSKAKDLSATSRTAAGRALYDFQKLGEAW